MVQKDPQSLCKVHAQQSNADDTERSFLQTRHDAVKPIAALANPKFALDNVSVADKHQRCAPAFPVLHSEAGYPAGRKCQPDSRWHP